MIVFKIVWQLYVWFLVCINKTPEKTLRKQTISELLHDEDVRYCFLLKSPTKTPKKEENEVACANTVFGDKILQANFQEKGEKTLPKNDEADTPAEEKKLDIEDRNIVEETFHDEAKIESADASEDVENNYIPNKDAEEKKSPASTKKRKDSEDTDATKKDPTSNEPIVDKKITQKKAPQKKVTQKNQPASGGGTEIKPKPKPKKEVQKKKDVIRAPEEDEPIKVEVIGRTTEDMDPIVRERLEKAPRIRELTRRVDKGERRELWHLTSMGRNPISEPIGAKIKDS